VLTEGEQGMSVFGWKITLPTSTSGIVLAALMVAVLLVRPNGLSNGREFRIPGIG
jgi:branched-chain amino acid transport system permease protein